MWPENGSFHEYTSYSVLGCVGKGPGVTVALSACTGNTFMPGPHVSCLSGIALDGWLVVNRTTYVQEDEDTASYSPVSLVARSARRGPNIIISRG